MSSNLIGRTLFLFLAFAALVPAQQTQFQFQLRVTQGKNYLSNSECIFPDVFCARWSESDGGGGRNLYRDW